jgi:hypothetical protein
MLGVLKSIKFTSRISSEGKLTNAIEYFPADGTEGNVNASDARASLMSTVTVQEPTMTRAELMTKTAPIDWVFKLSTATRIDEPPSILAVRVDTERSVGWPPASTSTVWPRASLLLWTTERTATSYWPTGKIDESTIKIRLFKVEVWMDTTLLGATTRALRDENSTTISSRDKTRGKYSTEIHSEAETPSTTLDGFTESTVGTTSYTRHQNETLLPAKPATEIDTVVFMTPITSANEGIWTSNDVLPTSDIRMSALPSLAPGSASTTTASEEFATGKFRIVIEIKSEERAGTREGSTESIMVCLLLTKEKALCRVRSSTTKVSSEVPVRGTAGVITSTVKSVPSSRTDEMVPTDNPKATLTVVGTFKTFEAVTRTASLPKTEPSVGCTAPKIGLVGSTRLREKDTVNWGRPELAMLTVYAPSARLLGIRRDTSTSPVGVICAVDEAVTEPIRRDTNSEIVRGKTKSLKVMTTGRVDDNDGCEGTTVIRVGGDCSRTISANVAARCEIAVTFNSRVALLYIPAGSSNGATKDANPKPREEFPCAKANVAVVGAPNRTTYAPCGAKSTFSARMEIVVAPAEEINDGNTLVTRKLVGSLTVKENESDWPPDRTSCDVNVPTGRLPGSLNMSRYRAVGSNETRVCDGATRATTRRSGREVVKLSCADANNDADWLERTFETATVRFEAASAATNWGETNESIGCLPSMNVMEILEMREGVSWEEMNTKIAPAGLGGTENWIKVRAGDDDIWRMETSWRGSAAVEPMRTIIVAGDNWRGKSDSTAVTTSPPETSTEFGDMVAAGGALGKERIDIENNIDFPPSNNCAL